MDGLCLIELSYNSYIWIYNLQIISLHVRRLYIMVYILPNNFMHASCTVIPFILAQRVLYTPLVRLLIYKFQNNFNYEDIFVFNTGTGKPCILPFCCSSNTSIKNSLCVCRTQPQGKNVRNQCFN